MTTSHDSDALRFVREEITGLRASFTQDLDRLRTSLDTLARDLSAFTGQQMARVAVLEARADEAARDIGELRASANRVSELERTVSAHGSDLTAVKDNQAEGLRHRNQIIAGLIVGLVVAVAAAVMAAIAATH